MSCANETFSWVTAATLVMPAFPYATKQVVTITAHASITTSSTWKSPLQVTGLCSSPVTTFPAGNGAIVEAPTTSATFEGSVTFETSVDIPAGGTPTYTARGHRHLTTGDTGTASLDNIKIKVEVIKK